MIAEVDYLEIPDCVELSNGDAKLVIPTSFGPRILFYGLDGGENVFGWHPGAAVETELGTWRPYGGHRLWTAPENMPLSYAPDNAPIEVEMNGELSVTLTGAIVRPVDLEKVVTVTLDAGGSGVTVDHKITNRGASGIEVSAWALTIMRPGGEAIVPHEPFRAYSPETLLPARTMALWPYTDLTDPRWTLDGKGVRLRCDERHGSQQKFGALNKQGWVAYEMDDVTFTKRFEHVDDAAYPDMNSSVEIYTAGGFIEVETLSPLRMLQAGESVEHQEKWRLERHGPSS